MTLRIASSCASVWKDSNSWTLSYTGENSGSPETWGGWLVTVSKGSVPASIHPTSCKTVAMSRRA